MASRRKQRRRRPQQKPARREPRRRKSQWRRGAGPSPRKPWGKAGKALDGVRILDFTHVQSGPTCTQLLGYMGADCIKVERPGVGDITRGQLRDVKGADSLYFTMLNGNKRSITHRFQAPERQGDPRAAGEGLRRAGRELRARHARSHGLHVGARPQAQPAHDHGVGERLWSRAVRRMQGLRERRAMCRRLGVDHGIPRRPAGRHRRADRRFRHRPAPRAWYRRGALSAQSDRTRPAGAMRRCRTACSTSRASSCAISSGWHTARSRNSASSAKAFRSEKPCRDRATIRVAASRAGFSSARVGRPIPTPTSTSSPRRRCGSRSAI